MTKEGVQTPASVRFLRKRPAVLPDGSKPARKSFQKLLRKTAIPEHLYQKPRRPMGVGFEHDGCRVGIHQTTVSLAPTRPVPW